MTTPAIPIVKLSIDVDLGPATLGDLARFLGRVNNLYLICYLARDLPHGPEALSTHVPPSQRLNVSLLGLSSPAHIAAAAKATQQAAQAAGATANAIETIATLRSRTKIKKAEAQIKQAEAVVAQESVEARVQAENAASRKAVAEAEQAELQNRLTRLEIIRNFVAAAREVEDEQVLAAARQALIKFLGLSEDSPAIERGARLADEIVTDTLAIEARSEIVPEEDEAA